ncbi:MAG: helix-turn-helix domain-containing protein [Bacteroidia bacterium]
MSRIRQTNMALALKSISHIIIDMKMDEIILRLDNLQRLIERQGIQTKEVLNFKEACEYLELSQSHLYKLTSAGSIPHYKPNGKKLYFKKSELESWLLRNRNSTQDEIDQKAADYLIKKGRVKL